MSQIDDFYDLDAWKISHKLAIGIYQITKNFPPDEKYSLVDQLRRSASSVGANLAEGYGRYHYKDKQRFYYLSQGSIKEVQNFLILAKDLKYIDEIQYKMHWDCSKDAERLINGLIKSIGNRI